MLTRLKVDGFKNLVGVDLAFGPYTCIAGANAVGKSNLFDAIEFLSLLAQGTFAEAVAGLRAGDGSGSSLSDLLAKSGDRSAGSMRFECELLIPRGGVDDLGQPLRASATYLRYAIELRVRHRDRFSDNPLELVSEELCSLPRSEALARLAFAGPGSAWIESVLEADEEAEPFLWMTGEDGDPTAVVIRPDPSARRGFALGAGEGAVTTTDLSRSVLSSTLAVYNPTVGLVQRELASWRRLQLDARAMREPDRFDAKPGIGRDGSGLARTLRDFLTRDARTDADREIVLELGS